MWSWNNNDHLPNSQSWSCPWGEVLASSQPDYNIYLSSLGWLCYYLCFYIFIKYKGNWRNVQYYYFQTTYFPGRKSKKYSKLVFKQEQCMCLYIFSEIFLLNYYFVYECEFIETSEHDTPVNGTIILAVLYIHSIVLNVKERWCMWI